MISMRALIDARRSFDRVEAFYRMFSFDLTYYGDNIVIEPRRITRVQYSSIASMLNALIRFSRQGENRFLIISHGNPQGLPIRIVPNNAATMGAELMNRMSGALDGRDSDREWAMSYADNSGRHVFRDERQLDDLLDLIRNVRRQRIEHIEFRGCNIGAGPALQAVHRLFGSRLTAAPTVQFLWSRLSTAHVRGTPQWLREHIAQMPAVRRQFNWIDCLRSPQNIADNEQAVFALAVARDGDNEGFRLLALNSDVIKGWTQSYLQPLVLFAAGQEPAGGGYRRGGFLPLIGFSTPRDRHYPFVFPGDGSYYTNYLQYEIDGTR